VLATRGFSNYIYTHMLINRLFAGLTFVLSGTAQLALQVVALPAQTAPAGPTVLHLRDALHEADRYAFANRLAHAANSESRARARLPLKGLLPSARVEVGAIRTTDPIAAFGTTLRQRRVTSAAFEPVRLNNPAAISNVQSGLVVEVPLFNADAVAGLRVAHAGTAATSASGEWVAVTTRANVVRAFYGAVLASEKAAYLETAQSAAQAATTQVQAMMKQGLVTKADVLQAQVRSADVASQRIAASNDALTALQQLGLLLGRQTRAAFIVPAQLPDASALRALATRDTLQPTSIDAQDPMNRADVRAARAGTAAAEADRLRARSTLLPRVNSFARYDWNSPTAIAGGQKNWTVGLMASWSLFNGGTEMADIASANARAAGAASSEEAALAQSLVEASASRRHIVVALQQLDLAEQAMQQSQEAHRLVEKRYAGGLATIAELLGAEASARASVLGHGAARYALLDAMVTHRRAIGADPAELSELEQAR